jgi:hypothetical protein
MFFAFLHSWETMHGFLSDFCWFYLFYGLAKKTVVKNKKHTASLAIHIGKDHINASLILVGFVFECVGKKVLHVFIQTSVFSNGNKKSQPHSSKKSFQTFRRLYFLNYKLFFE